MSIWFLSFRGGARDGAIVTEAPTPIAAIQRAWALGLNPGGQVAFQECDDTPEVRAGIDRLGGFDTWITVEQIKAEPHRKMHVSDA